ncbi:molybdopterin molybdotransferase MoeA [Thalassolituus maritimus]|uniref:Molybdopterin molybdenumtransferase n=1 Tax=Thalassolituus maritimus TaxID=484498 RepID=A0ABQ0A1W2_9GAMM
MTGCDQPGLTPVEDAIRYLLSQVVPITETQVCDLGQACGRVLANDVVSPMNVPPADNSAMDGYAVHPGSDSERPIGLFRQRGTVLAGEVFEGVLSAGECVRIMTGAVVPDGARLVVMQENTDVVDAGVKVTDLTALKPGDNIRRAGEDIQKGAVVLPAGRRLTPADCGLLASIGVPDIEVVRPLRVSLLTTGDELIAPGEALAPGKIYESNSFSLRPIFERLGAEVQLLTAVSDSLPAITDALKHAADHADIILTSGGVSVGEADFTREAVESLGQLDLWKLAMKPGKPLAFGRIGETLFIGLPGNPVSALVTLHQVGLPVIRTLSGETLPPRIRIPAIVVDTLRKRPGRADYQRGIAELHEDGQWQVRSTGQQGSGILSSVSRANCFIILEQDRGRVNAGETVLVEMFDQWLL